MLGNRDAKLDRLTAEIERLSKNVAELKGIDKALGSRVALTEQVEKLEKEKARLVEENAKTQREIDHKLGLHRKQIDHEREQLDDKHTLDVDRAKLEIERGNLQTEREAFQREMKFRTERFEKEVGYLKELSEQILKRLPDVSVAISRGNGAAED